MYIEHLENTSNWDIYLMEESGLPGPRANLELVNAVSKLGNEELFLRFISYSPDKAPVNSQEEILTLCGTVGLGKLIAEGTKEYFDTLRTLASDCRWRVREGVAMALQIYGENYMSELINEMDKWSKGNNFEKRAAIASLCEPKLLHKKEEVIRVLKIVNTVMQCVKEASNRKDESFQTLKKGLAYCWSVAIVAEPSEGKKIFESWIGILSQKYGIRLPLEKGYFCKKNW